jgi:hypothetical protein
MTDTWVLRQQVMNPELLPEYKAQGLLQYHLFA